MEVAVEGIGNRIRDRRKALGMTQQQLATKVGVGQDVVSKQEKNRMGVGAETLIQYAKVLETSVDWLAGEMTSAPNNDQTGRSAPTQVPIALARFLSDGRCNPITDEELAHLTKHLAEGNSAEPIDLEIHLLAYRAERERTEEALVRFRNAVMRSLKARGQKVLEAPLPPSASKKAKPKRLTRRAPQ